MANGRITFGEITSSAFTVFQLSVPENTKVFQQQINKVAAGAGSPPAPVSHRHSQAHGLTQLLISLWGREQGSLNIFSLYVLWKDCCINILLERLTAFPRVEDGTSINRFFMDEIYELHFVVTNIQTSRKVPHIPDCPTQLKACTYKQ